MYLNVAGDNLYQKITQKLKLFLAMHSIRVNTVLDKGHVSATSVMTYMDDTQEN